MKRDPLSDIELILKILSYQIKNKNKFAMSEIDEILHVLSNQTRRRMLSELASGEGFVNELVKRLDDHPQSIIRHLEVLKKHNLIVGKRRQGAGRGRPRLYYTLFPDLADLIRQTGEDRIRLNHSHTCSTFPRLNTIKRRLTNNISHSEQRILLSEVENLRKEHEMALEVCNEILDNIKKKVRKIPID